MSSSLILIEEKTASSDGYIKLTGMSSTYDVYQLVIADATPDTDAAYLRLKYTESGTENDTSNYDGAEVILFASSSDYNSLVTNSAGYNISNHTCGTSAGESLSANIYIFNPSDSNEYTIATIEAVARDHGDESYMTIGGMAFTVTSATDGVYLYFTSGNIASGEFKLYGLKK
tara:strand:- start:11 stop:529 length:519 start_codon:yes stop_codon:yes gene_type:complete